jgi:ATP-dependent DNA ligase
MVTSVITSLSTQLPTDQRDLRHLPLPLQTHKAGFTKLLRRPPDGNALRRALEGEGHRHACALGFEGIVSKRHDAGYKSGRCPNWVKVRNSACERR